MADDNGAMSVAQATIAVQRPVRKWRDDVRLRKLPVVVCTLSGVFVGDTYRLEEQRLLDALNRGFIARALRMAGDFMPLTDVELYSPGGKRVRLPSIHVHKSNILFVGEKKSSPDAAVGREIRRPQLIRAKTPLGAEIHVPPYVLEANVYVETWGELPEAIETDNRFLPLTDVRIRPVLPGAESGLDFVAVNREKILYVTTPSSQP